MSCDFVLRNLGATLGRLERRADGRWLQRTVLVSAGLVALLASGAMPSNASAASRADETPEQLSTCASCHGARGRSSAKDIPNLAGQQPAYLVRQLEAFRSGERKSELMQAIARQLTPQDIQTLARYWSQLPPDGGGSSGSSGVKPVPSAMQFPGNFPAGFIEYDREADVEAHTVTVRYVNPAVADAVKAGTALPSGATVLSGTFEVLLGADGHPMVDPQGRWKLGPLRSVAGMELRQGWGAGVPQLLRNGDWHYGLWSADGASRLNDMHARCLACHQPKSAQNYVFTWTALQASLARGH
jgi:cytochrome c553